MPVDDDWITNARFSLAELLDGDFEPIRFIQDVQIRHFKGLDNVDLEGCRRLNILIGKNNSGKTSILHALDMLGLAAEQGTWSNFEWKLQLEDLFHEDEPFKISLTYRNGQEVTGEKRERDNNPNVTASDGEMPELRSVLIVPNPSFGAQNRTHQTPKSVVDQVRNRNYQHITGLDMLYAIKFYGEKERRGFTTDDYDELVQEIKNFFPDIEGIRSERTEDDIATLSYQEYSEEHDILYSGGGLKHFVDVLMKMTVSKANLVLFDEIDNSLHPDLQRQLLSFLRDYAAEKSVQIFLTTHSPAMLDAGEDTAIFRVRNRQGDRSVERIDDEALHLAWGELGLRPSDLLQNDVVLLVEGQDDVIFFETVVEKFWKKRIPELAIAVQQFGGGAADGSLKGRIDVEHMAPANPYVLWIRDRDAPPNQDPLQARRRFKKKIEESGQNCHILDRREIGYYLPEDLLREHQTDPSAADAALKALNGSQEEKLRDLARRDGFEIPGGRRLKELLDTHLREEHLGDIEDHFDQILRPWAKEILGEI